MSVRWDILLMAIERALDHPRVPQEGKTGERAMSKNWIPIPPLDLKLEPERKLRFIGKEQLSSDQVDFPGEFLVIGN